MTRHDDRTRLLHMLDHAREAVEMVRGRERRDLDEDRQLELAVVRLLEIVGEAGARMSPSTRTAMPEVPWPEIVGLRNRVIHGYDSVDLDIVWETLQGDLPPIIRTLERHLESSAS